MVPWIRLAWTGSAWFPLKLQMVPFGPPTTGCRMICRTFEYFERIVAISAVMSVTHWLSVGSPLGTLIVRSTRSGLEEFAVHGEKSAFDAVHPAKFGSCHWTPALW